MWRVEIGSPLWQKRNRIDFTHFLVSGYTTGRIVTSYRTVLHIDFDQRLSYASMVLVFSTPALVEYEG